MALNGLFCFTDILLLICALLNQKCYKFDEVRPKEVSHVVGRNRQSMMCLGQRNTSMWRIAWKELQTTAEKET